MIVVTGVTGHVGRLVAREIAKRGEPARLLARNPADAPQLAGAEVVRADYGDSASLDRALGPGDRVFMVSVHEGPERRIALHRSFIDAAIRREVGFVVYLSFLAAGPDATFIHARSHGETERMLAESGLRWAAVRNGIYADNIPGWVDPDGVFREAGGDGRMSFSYRVELAEAIATILVDGGPEGVLQVTTPETVTLGELAELASQVTGHTYRYEPSSMGEWEDRWRRLGRSGWEMDAGRTSYEALAKGEWDVVGSDFHRLTGRAPLGIRAVLERVASEMPLR